MDDGTGTGPRATVSGDRQRSPAGTLMAVLLVLGFVSVGCDSGTPAVDPGNGGGPGNPVPTLRPVTGALAELLPTQVGDTTLEVESGDGEAGLALLPAADTESIAAQLEKLSLSIDRLSVAVAGDIEAANDEEGVAVIAVRVPGVLFTPSSGPQEAFVKSLLGVTGPTRSGRATLANKTTATIRQTTDDVSLTTYVYGPTEVIFIARGPEELLEQAFRQIPERP